MSKTFFILAACVLFIFLFNQCGQDTTEKSDAKSDSASASNQYGGYESSEKWGEHIVAVSGCHDCHTPKKMGPQGPEHDMTLALSGHPAALPAPDVDRKEMERKGLAVTGTLTAWVGPWGVSYAANLTPDSTGLAAWKEDQFIYAIRQGKFKGLPDSRPLLPPMPWTEYRHFTDGELKAIFAYLKTLKPISNRVPDALPPVSMAKK